MQAPEHVTTLTDADPRAFGSYQVKGRLGEGGQGIVYYGLDPNGEPVAIKTLHNGHDRPEARADFVREAENARRVQPFCTAQVRDADFDADPPYVVSEYVDGPSLQQFVARKGALAGGDLERLAIGMVTALVAIHNAGLAHLDFKPGNVIIGPDGPRVVDFGIAHRTRSIPQGMSLGTPSYMAPEQLDGAPTVGVASDVWAWAATVVFAGSGSPPFTGAQLVDAIKNGHPVLPSLEKPLADLVLACLNKDPQQRPSARGVLNKLIGGNDSSLDLMLTRGSQQAAPRNSAVTRQLTLAEESLAADELEAALTHAVKGIQLAKEFGASNQDRARCFHMVGLALNRLGRRGDAHLERAYDLDRANPVYSKMFARELLKRGQFDRAWEIAPEDERVQQNRRLREHSKAVLELRNHIEKLISTDDPKPDSIREALALWPWDGRVRRLHQALVARESECRTTIEYFKAVRSSLPKDVVDQITSEVTDLVADPSWNSNWTGSVMRRGRATVWVAEQLEEYADDTTRDRLIRVRSRAYRDPEDAEKLSGIAMVGGVIPIFVALVVIFGLHKEVLGSLIVALAALVLTGCGVAFTTGWPHEHIRRRRAEALEDWTMP